MKPNMGKADKNIRLLLGAIILLLGVYFESWFGLIGLIPIFTAFVSWCPLYVPLGISTIFKSKESN